MAERPPFSGLHLKLPDIVAHHQDLGASLRLYFSANSPNYSIRFAGYDTTKVAEELGERLNEIDLTSSLSILASIEAAFRIDYLQRSNLSDQDPVSAAFRDVYSVERERASLECDIFRVWLENSSVPSSVIDRLRAAFAFRHWLAHGRYWQPRLGRRYDFADLFELADLTLSSFPFHD